MLRIDFDAREIAVRIASSLPFYEVPVISSDLYTWSAMAVLQVGPWPMLRLYLPTKKNMTRDKRAAVGHLAHLDRCDHQQPKEPVG